MSRRRSTRIYGDFTLNDYANSASGRGIRKKTSLTIQVKKDLQTSTKASPRDDVSWFDKDLEEFGVANILDEEGGELEEEEEETKTTTRIHKQSSGHRKSSVRSSSMSNSFHGGDHFDYEYPLHVWFLLAEYIKPEDVVRFACICRSAYMATSCAKFWITLYKRYYNKQIKLPERLTPVCMERPRGLVACVIRTLFYTYPPFVERLRIAMAKDVGQSLLHLLRSYCVLAWHREHNKSAKPLWDFYFKFQKSSSNRYASSIDCCCGESPRLPDLLEFLGDINANEEQDCRVLKVTCTRYVSIPALMGMFLTIVNLISPTGDTKHQRLRLTFSRNAYCQPSRHQNQDDIAFVIEPASGVHVLDWWHPQYPYLS